MADCDRCTGDDGMAYTCNYCSGQFCTAHRLPENHNCPGLSVSGLQKQQDTQSRFRDWIDHVQEKATGSSSSSTPQPMPADELETYGGAKDPDTESSPDINPDGSLTTTDSEKSSQTPSTDDQPSPSPITRLVSSYTAFKQGLVRVNYGLSTAVRELISICLLLVKPTLAVAVVAGLAIALGPLSATVLVPGPLGESIDDVLDGGGEAGVAPANTTVTSTAAMRSTTTAATTTVASTELNETLVERLIHQYINERRKAHGLDPLAWDGRLQDIADYHSRDMVRDGYFAHESPDGTSMEDRYFMHDYECEVPTGDGEYATGGENIAYTYYEERVRDESGETHYYDTNRGLARGIVNQWMNSSGHRENILTDYWRSEGIGIEVTETSEGTRVYATQNFC